MLLSELKNNEQGVIVKVRGRGAFRRRITEMGFIRGKMVTVIKNAPLKDPIEYHILGYEVSLRRSEAALIEVITPNEAKDIKGNDFEGVITEDVLQNTAGLKRKKINVAFVGNPNAGKTTIFNIASGLNEKVGNYGGVTIDAKHGKMKLDGYEFDVVDLPGTYSLTAYTHEELYVREHIFNEHPDIVLNVIDSSNLERNLYLTTQLIDMDIKLVLALNMYDELEKKGDRLDYDMLGKMIGIPIVPTIGSKGKGIDELLKTIIRVYEEDEPTTRHIHINYGKEVETSIRKLQDEIWKNKSLVDKISSRFIAIKLLEKDDHMQSVIKQQCPNKEDIFRIADNEVKRLESNLMEDSETLITDAKYGFIAGALKETFSGGIQEKKDITRTIDTFLTHKVFGFPVFIFFIWLMFQTTFKVGDLPMGWIESGVDYLGDLIGSLLADGPLKDLIIDGIIGGVGGVIVFLPNILILFFFISLMEDTGYMARAAFIMDKLMHKIGLHGKSFIPLIMGFGCNVPAIMSTRMLKNRNDRLLTMLINPFMSCSARFPVYVLLTGAFFSESAGNIIFSIYLIGIFLAIVIATIFNKTFFKLKEVPFVMELPPYRMPTLRSIVRHMWTKSVQYLQKMGGIILIASVLIWALGYFPQNIDYSMDYDSAISNANTPEEKRHYEFNKQSEQQEKSYIGQLGKFIEPVISPLGFDWKMGVSIITGIAAKEIVVSTMGVLYQAEDSGDNSQVLIEKLKTQTYNSGPKAGEKVFSPLVAYVFMLFILIYFPCIAAITAIRKESGSWKWALFTIGYTTGLAWVICFLVYQIGQFFIN